jgi:hypothetical protein
MKTTTTCLIDRLKVHSERIQGEAVSVSEDEWRKVAPMIMTSCTFPEPDRRNAELHAEKATVHSCQSCGHSRERKQANLASSSTQAGPAAVAKEVIKESTRKH